MTFTFVSNYINHHQQPFCDAMYEKLGDGFTFVATMPMEQERIDMGWNTELVSLPYVRLLYEDPSCEQLIYESDVVLIGWSEREDIAQKRLNSGKLTLRVSERIYRTGTYKAISPRGLIAKYKEHIRYRNKPVFMLCAGAYVAADFALIHAYPGKMLKWGYFPPFIEYNTEDIDRRLKNPKSIQIIWVGRFISLKHPEYMVRLAMRLKEEGENFHIHMVGDGEKFEEIKDLVRERGLEEITLHGHLAPDEVRALMSECHVHISTSNHLEGWGAVINEGMNSGCIEIACEEMGAVPYLIKDNVNGLTYPTEVYASLEQVVLRVFHNWRGYTHLGSRAYRTIRDEWNAEVASDRLMGLVRALLYDEEFAVPESGPLSFAPIIHGHS
ncbi:MAG: glycosyltransferase [Lachnospiraceae bacterium]|nr:glycosyltransferase [Lachnospiraceae bacterium]